MHTSSALNFNYGKITFEEVNGKILIRAKIYLIEHIIFLASIVISSVYFGFFHFTKWQINLIIPFLTLLFIFVFAYLFPLMNFKTFFEVTIKKIYENMD